jgi:hypothetical protein
MRKAVKFMVAGGLSFLILVAGFVAYLGWELRDQPPTSALPALVRDVPGSLVTDIQKAFHNRVRNRFPNGIGADALAAELKREGFELRRTRQEITSLPPQDFAFVEQHGGMCLKNWTIWWHRDEQGRAQDIDGLFRFDCP